MVASLIVLFPFIWHNASYLGVRLNSGGSFQEVAYEQAAVGERSYLNAAANEIFSNHAVTGVGIGAYTVALIKDKPEFRTNYQPPHFVLLNAAAETGIFGALFYFLILAGPWAAMFFYRKRLDFSPSLIAAAGALAAVTVVGFFDYYPWLLAAGRFWQWMIWGLWASFFVESLNRKQDV
jgi:O-antigen ligase